MMVRVTPWQAFILTVGAIGVVLAWVSGHREFRDILAVLVALYILVIYLSQRRPTR